MVLNGLDKLKSSMSSVRAEDFLKKVGGNGILDANALWRGTTRPRGRAFPRQSMQTTRLRIFDASARQGTRLRQVAAAR